MYEHLILISLDTLRGDVIAACPDKAWPAKYPALRQPDTGVLDRIAGEGTYFDTCLAAAPYTSASHGSYFTGQFPLHHGLYEFFNRKLASATIFSHARRQGYRVRFKVDFPVILGPFLGFDRDVDEYLIEDDDGWLSSFRESRARSVNFVHFGGLHIPYGFHNLRFGGRDYVEKVEALERERRIDPSHAPADQLVETYRTEPDLALLMRYKNVVQHCYDGKAYDRLFELYLEGAEHFLRHRFAPFWERLLEAIRGTRTLVVLFGDHGEEYDEESYGHFNTVHDGVLRVPLIFWGDDIPRRRFSDRVRAVDLLPTLLDLLELPAGGEARLDGVSLASAILAGRRYPERGSVAQAYVSDTSAFIEFQRRAMSAGKVDGTLRHLLHREVIYDGDLRLVRRNFEWSLGGLFREMPSQLELWRRTDLRAWARFTNEEAEARLERRLDDYNAGRAGGPEIGHVPEEVRRQLQSMGYRV